MRAMGADLLAEAPATDRVHEGRASVWVQGDLLRTQFQDAAAAIVAHDLEPLLPLGEAADPQRHHLLLIGSRAADVRSYARNLEDQGWGEVARSAPAALGPGEYSLSLVDREA